MKFNSTTVEFTKSELRALLAHASDDETRPHVAAVYFDGRDKLAAATDGHRLAVCVGEGEARTWISLVPRAVLDTAVKTAKAESFVLHFAVRTIEAFGKAPKFGGNTASRLATFTYDAPKDDALSFPPFRQIMTPAAANGVITGFNAEYLADLALVQRAAKETSNACGVLFCAPDALLAPAKCIIGSWTVMIMPMRVENDDAATLAEIRRAEAAVGPARDTVLCAAEHEIAEAERVAATMLKAA